jgi:hypothetical protein
MGIGFQATGSALLGGFPVSTGVPNGAGFTSNIGAGYPSPISGTVTLN